MSELRIHNSAFFSILITCMLLLPLLPTIPTVSSKPADHDFLADQPDASPTPISISVSIIPALPPDIIVKTLFNVEITITNEGDNPIYDIEVTPSMPEAELTAKYLIYPEPSLKPNKNAKYIFCFYGKSAGIFTMSIPVSYKGHDGALHSQSKEVEVPIISPPSPMSVSLVVPRKISLGDTFETRVWVTNDGEYTISTIEVDLEPTTGFSVISERPKVMKHLDRKETQCFLFQLKAQTVGSFTLTAPVSYLGYGGEQLSKTGEVEINITKTSTLITYSIAPEVIHVGDEVTITGQISPPVRDSVHLTFTKPDGTQDEVTAPSTVDGKFTGTYTPRQEGKWTVKINWRGDLEHEAASTEVTFNVGKACIIATSTYGSEVAPEVRFLRAFRDQTVYSTFAGTQFMSVFDAWYYSFSPSVASFIASNPPAKGVMKGVLYPLMGILHLSTEAHSLFNFNSEVGIAMAGLVAGSLIGAVYFSPPTVIGLLALKRHRKRQLTVGQLRPLLVPWLGSIVLMLLAEVTVSQALMAVSAGVFVVLTIALTAGAIALSILRHLY